MDEKSLTAAAKRSATATIRYANYKTERAEKRTAFDAETASRTAELEAEMNDAQRSYSRLLNEIRRDDGANDAAVVDGS